MKTNKSLIIAGIAAAHDTRHDHWYVIPAQIVVTLIARTKTRGQHTENPFESATLSLPALAATAFVDPPVTSPLPNTTFVHPSPFCVPHRGADKPRTRR